MPQPITLFWFRQDLRITDNPGLFAAAQNGSVLPIYILDDEIAGTLKMGEASRWWLHHSLTHLDQSLGHKLNVYIGNTETILQQLLKQHAISAVYWNRCYEPFRVTTDTKIKTQFQAANIECKTFNASLLWEPWQILKSDKTPYKVYTPFYHRGCLSAPPPRALLPKPKAFTLVKDSFNHTTIMQLKLLPAIQWYQGINQSWEPGEEAAQKKLTDFLEYGLLDYQENRNYPARHNVSRLSPHLHFGEISPHQIWHHAKAHSMSPKLGKDLSHFLSEIAWREFSYYLLYHFPELPRKNFQTKFDNFPWQHPSHFLTAWQTGQTGYPIVDAGMRELWQTGYMHNRVRMIVGSFLVKNLLLHWHHGFEWFWDCLVDADLANNSASWQWIAGSGADAAPYFRIFNPVLQGEKFDTQGDYTRRFVPELRHLPNRYLFKPWEAPEDILKIAKVTLGETYPLPIVNLKISRDNALQAYRSMSGPK